MNRLRTNINAAAKTAEILIYGPIGKSFWDESGISAKEFSDELNKIPKGTQITVGINSQGGAIGEGLAIFNAIARRGSDITARIDGYALSAGSFIPLAAGKVISPESSIWMIHKGWMMAMGNADEMRKAAELLDTHDGTLLDIYANHSNKSRSELESALSEETWLSGKEAVEWGLADETGGDVDTDAMDSIDLSAAPAGVFRRNPVLALAALHQRILAGPTGNQTREASTATTRPVVDPADTLQTAGTLPVAACPNNKTKGTEMEPTIAPAQAATPQPALDLTPVIEAINGLRESLTPAPAAAAPVSPSRIENLGNPAVERYNSLQFDKLARGQFVRENYATLQKEMRAAAACRLTGNFDRFDYRSSDVMAANTVDSGLANSLLSAAAISVMRTRLGPLAAFTRKVELSPVSKRQVINVPLVSSAGSVQSNATNYETGDTTAGTIAVTVNEVSKSFAVSRPEQNLGLALAQLAPTNAKVMAEGVMALVSAVMVAGDGATTGFGAATAIGAGSAMSTTVLKAILALAANYTQATLILHGSHLAYLLPTDRDAFRFGEEGAYGFDGGIYKHNLYTGATSNTVGFVCGPDAIAVGMGMPADLPAGEAISVENVTLEGDISVQSTVWFSRASRSFWGCYALMFGAKCGDGTQGEILVTT